MRPDEDYNPVRARSTSSRSNKLVTTDSQKGIASLPGMPLRVWTSAGLTINTGNYESLRIEAGCSLDAQLGETAKNAFQRCWHASEAELRRRFASIANAHLGKYPFVTETKD